MDWREAGGPDMHVMKNGREIGLFNWKGGYVTRHHGQPLPHMSNEIKANAELRKYRNDFVKRAKVIMRDDPGLRPIYEAWLEKRVAQGAQRQAAKSAIKSSKASRTVSNVGRAAKRLGPAAAIFGWGLLIREYWGKPLPPEEGGVVRVKNPDGNATYVLGSGVKP